MELGGRPPQPVVLAVDDDEAVREALRLVLEDSYEVAEAPDGTSALAVLRSREVDLVLLDILLGGIDGLAVLEQIRAVNVDIPVVMLSGINTAWTAAAAMRLGAVDYMTKPFDEHELLAVVASSVRQRAETTRDLRPANILLMGCPLGIAAALTAAIAEYAAIKTIALSSAFDLRSSPTPDVVVLGLENGATGREVGVKTLTCFPSASLILLGTEHQAFASAEAREFVHKSASFSELFEGIRAVLRHTIRPLPHFSARTLAVMEYLSANFSQTSVRDLGRAFETSPYYLSRAFRSDTGMSLKTYINRVRIETARQLLSRSKDTIERVAKNVGFHDASHLSRVCLRYSGHRPSELRRL